MGASPVCPDPVCPAPRLPGPCRCVSLWRYSRAQAAEEAQRTLSKQHEAHPSEEFAAVDTGAKEPQLLKYKSSIIVLQHIRFASDELLPVLIDRKKDV